MRILEVKKRHLEIGILRSGCRTTFYYEGYSTHTATSQKFRLNLDTKTL